MLDGDDFISTKSRSISEDSSHSLNAESIFQQLYKDLSLDFIQATSTNERKGLCYNSSTLSYGDIEFSELVKLFQELEKLGFRCDRHSHFVDIGCGAGKPIFAAALLQNFTRCTGIEILSGLHSICEQNAVKWNRLCTKLRLKKKLLIDVDFICGDALEVNWSDADLVFIHGTCFNEAMVNKLFHLTDCLKPHSFVVSISVPLVCPHLHLLHVINHVILSWGISCAYVYSRRISSIHEAAARDQIGDDEFLALFGILRT